MAETAWSVDQRTAVATSIDAPRHTALVRVTHWLTTICFLALLVSGLEIVVSHPRFYWGESGNVLTPALFSFPIPSSRATVPTGYGYVLRDQNGWSRSLHFEAAWVLVLTGVLYVIWGALSGHFRKDLLPDASDRSVQTFSRALARHIRFARPVAADAWSYNLVQSLADALHPQTLLAYAMNGADLPVAFGGPLRLRVPRQLGYKSVKYINRLAVTDSLKRFGKGLGSASPEGGYAWYAGI